MRDVPRAGLLLICVLALIGSGCTGRSTRIDTSEPVDRPAARELFQRSCRTCHSLADASAAGTFGPDLDQLQPDARRVREQIASGGDGMPKDLLTGDDAQLVARYVAEVAGAGTDHPSASQSAPAG